MAAIANGASTRSTRLENHDFRLRIGPCHILSVQAPAAQQQEQELAAEAQHAVYGVRNRTGPEQPVVQRTKEIRFRTERRQHKYGVATDVFGSTQVQDEIAIQIYSASRIGPNDLWMLSGVDEMHVDSIPLQSLESKIGIAGGTLPVVDDLYCFADCTGHSFIDP
jgi:hypothetical protein